MSRWSRDPEGAADDLVLRSLDDLAIAGRVLLCNQAGALPAEILRRGVTAEVWNRRVAGSHPVSAWPTGGPFDMALLRLPKAKEEQEMTAHAVLGELAPGGRLIVYGGNEEGIRSATRMLERLCGAADTLATRGHGRVVSVRSPDDPSGLRRPLAAWRRTSRVLLAGGQRDWVSYPGIFAEGRIDEGSQLLVDTLPRLAAKARVLDYGCGSGIIGAAAIADRGDIELDMLDADAVALAAAGENVPGGRLIPGARLSDAGRVFYDAILSNPPLHSGLVEDHSHLQRLIGDAPARLKPNGILQIVVQRRVALERMLAESFGAVAAVTETGTYRVWRATRPKKTGVARRA